MPAFADTNVVVYAFAKDEAKIAIAEGILEKQPTISVQVISEFLNVCRTKLGMDLPTRHKLAGELIAGCNVVALDPGLLAPEALEKIIAEALRRRTFDELLSVADRVEAAGIPPMSAEELNAEIQAYRMDRRRAGG